MSRGVNKVTIIGNLGKDPEARVTSSGGVVTHINVATSSVWKDKQGGHPQERTEWHRIIFFNKLAEVARDYLHKGSRVYIEGSLRTNKWQDKQGIDHYTTEIVAQTMQMLGGRENTTSAQQEQSMNAMPMDDFTDEVPF